MIMNIKYACCSAQNVSIRTAHTMEPSGIKHVSGSPVCLIKKKKKKRKKKVASQ